MYEKNNNTLLLTVLIMLQSENHHEENKDCFSPFPCGKLVELVCINDDTFKSIGKFYCLSSLLSHNNVAGNEVAQAIRKVTLVLERLK